MNITISIGNMTDEPKITELSGGHKTAAGESRRYMDEKI